MPLDPEPRRGQRRSLPRQQSATRKVLGRQAGEVCPTTAAVSLRNTNGHGLGSRFDACVRSSTKSSAPIARSTICVRVSHPVPPHHLSRHRPAGGDRSRPTTISSSHARAWGRALELLSAAAIA